VLDHLFFDLPAGWTATRRVIKDAYGSDHHPVVAIVSLEQASD
jgi:endonuclease/exonuclease/phosphatase (EEP) superfamily protein YafD